MLNGLLCRARRRSSVLVGVASSLLIVGFLWFCILAGRLQHHDNDGLMTAAKDRNKSSTSANITTRAKLLYQNETVRISHHHRPEEDPSLVHRSSSCSSEEQTKPCPNLEAITKHGQWNNETLAWEVDPAVACCNYQPLIGTRRGNTANRNKITTTTQNDIQSCFSQNNYKQIGFYGDSTLRNIVRELLKLGNATKPIKMSNVGRSPSYHNGGGTIVVNDSRGTTTKNSSPVSAANDRGKNKAKGSGGSRNNGRINVKMNKAAAATTGVSLSPQLERIKIDMWWTPSAYFQQPHTVGFMKATNVPAKKNDSNQQRRKHDDISVISISVWDMGTYYRGVNVWYKAMKQLLRDAAKARQEKPLYIMHLHRINTSKCLLKHNTTEGLHKYRLCQACNKEDAMYAFREALEMAVRCVQSKFKNIHFIDPYDITNTPFAQNRSIGGVHFDSTVTRMELDLLLQSICNGIVPTMSSKFSGSGTNENSCPVNPKLERGKSLDCQKKKKSEWSNRRT